MRQAIESVSLFGFDFRSFPEMNALVADIMAHRKEQGVRQLITPNASTIVYYNEPANRPLKDFYAHSRYIIPDGMPIVWLNNFKGLPPIERLPGSDLFPMLWKQLQAESVPVVFVVANEMLAHRFIEEYPHAHTIVPTFFSPNDDEYIAQLATDVAEMVQREKAGFVFLGLNFPKQEKLGMQITKRLKVDPEVATLILLLGASFEFYFGLKSRAPKWIQRSGLEWLHRFMQEPGRLWRRYTVDSSRFIRMAVAEYRRK
jgi:N-acetylglucosaminyldiphosphoundecaprenol N-acetyl-beta-D-mannosaminyltransferase